jgi:hypothetical protein
MKNHESNLLQRLHDAGVTLTVDEDRLRYRAPAGALTPELRAAVEELKPDLLYEFQERAGILEYDAGLPRAEAEARAADIVKKRQPESWCFKHHETQ